MIISFDKPNQLCNRIWSQAPVIAKAIGSGQTLKIPFFGKYFNLFQNLNLIENIYFSKFNCKAYGKTRRISVKLLRLLPKSVLKVFNVCFTDDLSAINWDNNKGITYASGWNSRYPLIDSHSYLVKIFEPKQAYKNKVDVFFTGIKSEVKIGVHLRRGDYKNYKNGIHYFEDAIYKDFISQVVGFPEFKDREVVFVLCSNEYVDVNDFHPFRAVKMEDANPIEDLYALSLCDYLMGPLSSFSQWASFYGQVPLCFLERNKPISLSGFKKVIGQNQFSN